ncbi:MAG: GH3 family domain-containing protein, partial [Opitutaceae bacterium]
MPAWLRRLRPLRLALREAAGARRLHRDENAPARQDRAFAELVPALARASHWAAAGLEPGIDYATFRRRLPLTTPAALAPQVDRMRRGEAGVLWPGPCTRFVRSAGTATGVARVLPVPDALGEHFQRAHEAVLLHARLWSGRHGLLAAPHLFLGAPPAAAASLPPPWPAADPFTLFGATAAATEAGHRFLPGPALATTAPWTDPL